MDDRSHYKPEMTVGDALSIIVLYQRIFSTTNKKIMDSADEFVVNRDTFCKGAVAHVGLAP